VGDINKKEKGRKEVALITNVVLLTAVDCSCHRGGKQGVIVKARGY